MVARMAKKRSSTGARSATSSRTAPTADHRIVVLHGKEAFLRSLYADQLRDALAQAYGEVESIRFPGASATLADVLDECRSFGLMQQHKLVTVDEADKFVSAQTRPALERYAANPVDSATLLLRSDGWRPGKLDKAIAKVGVVIKCAPLEYAQAAAWAERRSVKRHDCAIEPTAVKTLLERVGVDLGRLDAELAKLAAMAMGQPITPELVSQAVGLSREEEVWAIQSRLIGHDPSIAIRAVREALGASKQPTVLVSFAMIDLARKLHASARLMRAGTPDMQVARRVKVWGDAQRAILSAAHRADPDTLADLLDESVQADAKSKSGRTDPKLALERLAIRFASI
jgi:DNA polymerase III subunit delta